MTVDRAALRALLAEATGRPWAWRGNVDNWNIWLGGFYDHVDKETGGRRRWGTTVLDFARWGMRGARPRFNVDNLMHNGDEFAVYEVARTATSRKDPRVYRGDIVDLRHPDARLIPAAVNALPALLDDLDAAEHARTAARAAAARWGAYAGRLRARAEAAGLAVDDIPMPTVDQEVE